MPVETHEINLQGLSGAIFWTSLSAVVFVVIGFSSDGWTRIQKTNVWSGLWASHKYSGASVFAHDDWFKAVQAMACLSLIFLSFAFILILLYNFLHSTSLSKSLTLKMMVACLIATVLMIFITVVIYGVKASDFQLHWSYAFFIIGGFITIVVLVLSFMQMRRASIF
ncbi:hypothetical protein HELRODRAFT_163319 [Helobdella robusta]|uniref:Uncharacterized protein n=1 Tax=Helobdella robusta TaxID=6412 RepID=T1ETW8_HELRO|nr:hypothetical protein HELRODRAFT_163319 [Helobdella robusta]ESN96272.1 hypothetical protein HELRODRAFT_163319 [Helobdella robusta]